MIKAAMTHELYVSKHSLELYQDYLYVGPGNGQLHLKRSPLANPFTHKKNDPNATYVYGGKQAVVRAYRKYLWDHIKSENKRVIADLLKVKDGTVLVGPFWHNEPHTYADIIVKAAQWLKDAIAQN